MKTLNYENMKAMPVRTYATTGMLRPKDMGDLVAWASKWGGQVVVTDDGERGMVVFENGLGHDMDRIGLAAVELGALVVNNSMILLRQTVSGGPVVDYVTAMGILRDGMMMLTMKTGFDLFEQNGDELMAKWDLSDEDMCGLDEPGCLPPGWVDEALKRAVSPAEAMDDMDAKSLHQGGTA